MLLSPKLRWLLVFACVSLGLNLGQVVRAADEAKDEPKKDQGFSIGEGKFLLTAPDKWIRKQPKTKIVEHEFAVPAVEGETEDGRLTVMGAGGAIDDNISRWIGQFAQPDAKDIKKDKKTISGQEVHFVDIAGTYKDSVGGPFAGGKVVERPDYRMMAVIVATEKDGNYFIKLYGPKKTIAANEEGFTKMIEGLKAK